MAELASLTFPITKRVTQSDGTLIIEGPVTDDSLDLDGQIVDAASAAKSLQEWFDAYANVRQQHSPLLDWHSSSRTASRGYAPTSSSPPPSS